MSTKVQALTEKEKQTLRLVVRGHDAKSLARHLGLSVHTVNERLRDARRKLEVSSSREAARMLLAVEVDAPENDADRQIGDAAANQPSDNVTPGTASHSTDRRAGVVAGVTIMSIIIGMALLSLVSGQTPAAIQGDPAQSSAAVDTEAVRSARDWLVLGDQGRWKDGWLATAASFRKVNSVERWTDAATKVRVPMGALVSRTLLSSMSTPTPPNGAEIVRFRSSFANRADVIETVSLVREGGTLRVNGIYVE